MHSTSKSRIFHVYPYWPGAVPDPKRKHPERTEEGVWGNLGGYTRNLREDQTVVFVPSKEFDKDFILEKMGRGTYDHAHIKFHEAIRKTATWNLPNGGTEKIDKTVPHDLHDLACQRLVAADLKDRDVLVVFLQFEAIDEPPFDLSLLLKLRAGLTVYIFHKPHETKWGVYEEGEDAVSVEEEFPALNSLLHKEMEIIVDKLLAKGGIHIWSGMFEAYKTTALIELLDAILSFDPSRTDNRKAFEYFGVHARYEVLLLEADMDMAQFDDYARPWNLRRHGVAFRVNRPDSEVLRGLDDPLLQQAVNGRILAIDTMLDYARIQRAFESGEWIEFFQKLRRLINVHGCVAIVMLVHPTKTGARSTTLEPTEFLKDSITFGGKIDAGMAFSPLENGSEVFIQPVKGRAFRGDKRGFTIMHHGNEGENFLDMGRFPVCKTPETAGKREDHAPETRGRKGDPQHEQKVAFLMQMEGQKIGIAAKAERLNEEFKSRHPAATIKTWITEGREKLKKKAEEEKQLPLVPEKAVTTEDFVGGNLDD